MRDDEDDEAVPSRRWRWIDLGICLMDFAAESAYALARSLGEINNSMRAHYNWEAERSYQRQMLVEHDTISLTGE